MINPPPPDNAASTATAPPSLRRPWRRILLTLVIFLGGAACGAAAATMAWKHSLHHAIQNPHDMASHITDRLSDFLDLSHEQAGQVREIILRRHNALIDIRRDIQPRLETELATLEQEIATVLNADQRPKWHAHAAAVRAQWLPPIPEPVEKP